jgi:plasmid stabilization system protein ParE
MIQAFRRDPLFKADVLRQFLWYCDEAGEEVAWRFEAAVEHTLLALARQPDLGQRRRFKHPKLRNLHSIPVQRPFNKLLLFYRVGDDYIEAWRLMHGARDLARRLAEPPD